MDKFSKLSSMGVMSNFAAGLNELKDADKTKPDPEFQVNINNGMTFGVAPMQRTRIQMDTSKAMAILGFSSSQTFEATKLEEVEKAFLRKMEVLLKQKKKKRRNSSNPRADEDTLNKQIRNVNEAMQFLARKRTKSKLVQDSWHTRGNKTALVGMAINAMTVDEKTRMMRDPSYMEKMKQLQLEQEMQSEEAVNMAEALIAGIEKKHEEQSKERESSKRRYIFHISHIWVAKNMLHCKCILWK